jgi:hypothetical protein
MPRRSTRLHLKESCRGSFQSGCNPEDGWNKGKLVGQKPPLRLKELWAIRIRLQLAKRARELALFSLALDSKLCACDLLSLRVGDVAQGTEYRLAPSCFSGRPNQQSNSS